MANKRTTPEPAAGASRRKRAAPTIDLTATEVPSTATASKPPPAQPAADHEAAPADKLKSENNSSGQSWNWLRANIKGPTLAAGAAGAAIVTLVLFGLWLTGMVPIRYAGSTAMRARVAGLEMQVQELQHRPAGAVDTKSNDAFMERMSKIEEAITKLAVNDPSVAERIAANVAQARERAEAAEKAVTELRTSMQDIVKDAAKNASAVISSAELDALQKRIAELEQSAKIARDEIAKTGASETAARLALSAAALRDAALSGAPLAAALAQAKSLGADEKALAPLAPFSASGLPTQATLAQELRALVPALLKLSGAQAPAGGFLERLQANAGKLVRIHPVDAPPGDDASAVLARVEIDAANADIAAALTDLGKLPDATRAPALSWIAKAQARQAALTVAVQFAAETARTLGPPPSSRAGTQ